MEDGDPHEGILQIKAGLEEALELVDTLTLQTQTPPTSKPVSHLCLL